MPYHAVVFDLFGTLVPGLSLAGYHDIVNRLAAELGAPACDFAQAWADTFDLRCKGKLGSADDSLRAVAQMTGTEPSEAQVARAAAMRFESSRAAMCPRLDAETTLAELCRLGLRVGLLSDATREIPPLWAEGSLAPYFSAVVFSCEVGLRKPDARMYALVSEALRVEPSDCLYVGDGGSSELSGASVAGMDPVLIRVPDDPVAYRVDAEEWVGPRIERLSEILTFVR